MFKGRIRPSKRPLASVCASSVLAPDVEIDQPHDARSLGNDVHAVLATVELVDTEGRAFPRVDSEQLDQLVAKWPDDGEALVSLALGALTAILDSLPADVVIRTEVPIIGELGTGTADLVIASAEAHAMVVADWKSGWIDADARDQILAYAHGLLGGMADGTTKALQINLRHKRTDVWDVTQEDFDALEGRDRYVREKAGEVYVPGGHCGYCRMRFECTPHRQWVGRSITVLGEQSLDLRTHGAEVHERIKVVEKLCADLRVALRAEVIAGGPIETRNGKALQIVEGGKETIDPVAAWSYLAGALSQDELAGATKISKGSLVKAVREKATGTKIAAEKEFLTGLRATGAVSRETYTKLEERKTNAG